MQKTWIHHQVNQNCALVKMLLLFLKHTSRTSCCICQSSSDELDAYVHCFTAIVVKTGRRATPSPRQVGPKTVRTRILNSEPWAFFNLKRSLREKFIVSGDPATKQTLSETGTISSDTLLVESDLDNNSDFSVWKLTIGIKRQPLYQSPVHGHNGIGSNRWF